MSEPQYRIPNITLRLCSRYCSQLRKLLIINSWREWGTSNPDILLVGSSAGPFEPTLQGVAENVRQLNLRVSTLPKTLQYSPTIQGVGADGLRSTVGTFRNVIVARWACKLLKMWWQRRDRSLANRICNLQILKDAGSAKSARMPKRSCKSLAKLSCVSESGREGLLAGLKEAVYRRPPPPGTG
jgi:hypothetical protein